MQTIFPRLNPSSRKFFSSQIRERFFSFPLKAFWNCLQRRVRAYAMKLFFRSRPHSLTWWLLIIQFRWFYEIRWLAVRNVSVTHAIKRIWVLEIHAFWLHCCTIEKYLSALRFSLSDARVSKNRRLPLFMKSSFWWVLLSSFIRASCFWMNKYGRYEAGPFKLETLMLSHGWELNEQYPGERKGRQMDQKTKNY